MIYLYLVHDVCMSGAFSLICCILVGMDEYGGSVGGEIVNLQQIK